METYFEHLINTVYHTYQDALIKKYSSIYPLRSAVVKFGGFQLSYNWKGRTRLGKETVGNLTIYTKEIHLNILFAYRLAGLNSGIPNFAELFSFEELINTIAHELAHAIINTFWLNYEKEHGGHGDLHDEYTDQIEDLIKTDPRYEEFMLWWREKQKT